MTNEELYEIAEYFINNDDRNCMSFNYAKVDYKKIDPEQLRNDIKDEFKYNLLHICGCGNPEIVLKGIYNILKQMKDENDNSVPVNLEWIKSDWTHLFTLYMIDNAGLTDHGTGIYGCWITDLGKWYLKIFDDEKFYYKNIHSMTIKE